jgi:hypothetical protein
MSSVKTTPRGGKHVPYRTPDHTVSAVFENRDIRAMAELLRTHE